MMSKLLRFAVALGVALSFSPVVAAYTICYEFRDGTGWCDGYCTNYDDRTGRVTGRYRYVCS